jgi:hypothetical protein
LCRRGKAAEALQRLRGIMGKLKLTVNEEKTRICKVPEGEFDFSHRATSRLYTNRRFNDVRPTSARGGKAEMLRTAPIRRS